jgi:hypothetical protein
VHRWHACSTRNRSLCRQANRLRTHRRLCVRTFLSHSLCYCSNFPRISLHRAILTSRTHLSMIPATLLCRCRHSSTWILVKDLSYYCGAFLTLSVD